MPPKRIALFGGSFNPPHWAHREVCDYLRGLDRFDEVWMVPTFDHPFEKGLASFSHRKKMCELTVAGLGEKVSVCSVEEELKNKPSYMIDTLLALKKRHPDNLFTVVVGSDCKEELPKWKDWESLKKEGDFFYIPRPGFEASPFMDISSTRIRQLVKEKGAYTKYVVQEVEGYIKQYRLYVDK